MSNNTVTLLLVEDDDVAAEAVERAFRKAKIANPIVRARDGVEALAMLHDKSVPPTVSRPHQILLDLKMPRMNGLTFLQELRNDPELKQTIVLVISKSGGTAETRNGMLEAQVAFKAAGENGSAVWDSRAGLTSLLSLHCQLSISLAENSCQRLHGSCP